MEQHNDRWLRIFSPFVLIIIALYNGKTLIPPYTSDKLAYGLYAIICFGIGFEVARFLIFAVRERFPLLQQTGKRMRIAFLVVISAVFLFKLITFQAYRFIWKPDTFQAELIIGFILETILIAVISIGLYEALYFYTRYLKAEKEKEQLRRANLQSQFDSLKTQVNPHFLFNSLNSLTALISKDCERAEQFVEEMSTVYRYLLRNNIDDLTTLRDELQFIRSYLHMQETRFGKGLQYIIDVDEECQGHLLPPLTLQMLVENAIKHNVISTESPLRILITMSDHDRLIVRNNLQKKQRRVFSGKVGLANIISKYKLLDAPEVEIEENEKEFIVAIPLILTHEPAHTYHRG
jgi:sensor histidine kinase YesM